MRNRHPYEMLVSQQNDAVMKAQLNRNFSEYKSTHTVEMAEEVARVH